MKYYPWILAVFAVLVWLLGYHTGSARGAKEPFVNEPRMAAGEWKVEMQTPPCDSVHNMQVIWPKESGYPLTIECDSMPVPTR